MFLSQLPQFRQVGIGSSLITSTGGAANFLTGSGLALSLSTHLPSCHTRHSFESA